MNDYVISISDVSKTRQIEVNFVETFREFLSQRE